MSAYRQAIHRALSQLAAVIVVLLLAQSAPAYDFPLSENAIRDAYFLGTRTGGLNPDFLARYARVVPDLKQGNCTSSIRIETPFLQVARHVSGVPNYSAQDAVAAFYGKPLVFRIYLDICYQTHAPANAIKVRVLQQKKELLPLSFESSPFSEPTEFGFLPPNGEQITLEFDPAKIDPSRALTILVDTPNGEQALTELDLAKLR